MLLEAGQETSLHEPKPQMARLPSPYDSPGVEIWETPFGRAHDVTSEAQAVLSAGKRQAQGLWVPEYKRSLNA